MRFSLLAATSVATLFVTVGSTPSLAQNTQAPPPRAAVSSGGAAAQHGIAVIDVTSILEKYNKLNMAKDVFKRDAERAEVSLKAERDKIQKQVEAAKAYKPGTEEYKRAEEAISKMESDWKIKVTAQRRDFAERESQTFLKAYRELEQAVKVFAERNGITLVLRFNGTQIDPNNREMVQMEIFKMVMYYDKSIDITPQILAELNRAAGPAGGVASPPRSPQGTRTK